MPRATPVLLALAIAFAGPPVSTGAAPATPLNTGYWQVTTDWLGLVKKTERYCLTPKSIAKIMLGPCNHHYKCDYPIQQVEAGKTHFEGQIKGDGELYHVKGNATFTLTSLDMYMTGSGHWHIVPILGVHAAVKAHFLDPECPAGAKNL